MFSATWGHISCAAIAPALRFPRFLFVNHSWQFSQTTKLPVPVLCRKHSLVSRAGNPVVRLSYPQLFSLHIITVLQPLLLQGRTNTIDFTPQTQLTFFLLKVELQGISYMINSLHPQLMASPFLRPQSMPSFFGLFLLICVARFPGYSLSYSKRSGLHFSCTGCLQSQKHFLWIKFSSRVLVDTCPC